MSNTHYKSVILRGRRLSTPRVDPVRPNTLAKAGSVAHIMRSQDTALVGARRVVAHYTRSGSAQWQQPDGTVDPSGTSHDYPDSQTWRRLAESRAYLSPGCHLEARVWFIPCGLTERQDGADWIASGTGGGFRVRISWQNLIFADGPDNFVVDLPGSFREWGKLPTSAGANWSEMDSRLISDIQPPGIEDTISEAEKWSEPTELYISLEIRGGARIVAAVVYEVPTVHVQLHNDAQDPSAHGFEEHGQVIHKLPVQYPQESEADGATKEERRFGSHQTLDVMEKQAECLGPRLFNVTSQRESAGNWSSNVPEPYSNDGTWRSLWDDSNVYDEYDVEAPGVLIAASYAQLHELNDHRVVLRGRAAVIPVRVWVAANWSGAGSAWVRVQTGPWSFIDVEVTGTATVGGEFSTATGYLECQTAPDQLVGIAQIFMWAEQPGTGTLSVYAVTAQWHCGGWSAGAAR